MGEDRQASGLPSYLTSEFKTMWSSEVGGFLPGNCAESLGTKNTQHSKQLTCRTAQLFIPLSKWKDDNSFLHLFFLIWAVQPRDAKPLPAVQFIAPFTTLLPWSTPVLLTNLMCCQRILVPAGLWAPPAVKGSCVAAKGSPISHAQPYRNGFQPGAQGCPSWTIPIGALLLGCLLHISSGLHCLHQALCYWLLQGQVHTGTGLFSFELQVKQKGCRE